KKDMRVSTDPVLRLWNNMGGGAVAEEEDEEEDFFCFSTGATYFELKVEN
ncbi:hypothetical protein KI387_029574, partial [Taxus chinensis]